MRPRAGFGSLIQGTHYPFPATSPAQPFEAVRGERRVSRRIQDFCGVQGEAAHRRLRKHKTISVLASDPFDGQLFDIASFSQQIRSHRFEALG
jgi:hypothetical protein